MFFIQSAPKELQVETAEFLIVIYNFALTAVLVQKE